MSKPPGPADTPPRDGVPCPYCGTPLVWGTDGKPGELTAVVCPWPLCPTKRIMTIAPAASAPGEKRPCWVCGKRAFWGPRFGWLCGEHAQAANDMEEDVTHYAPAAPDASQPFIPSRGEIGAPPPDPHPAPWRWVETTGPAADGVLVDDEGMALVYGAPQHPPSPRVRALIELAPNLERLREIEWVGEGRMSCPVCGNDKTLGLDQRPGSHDPDCWLGNTLAALDKVGR